LNRSGHTIVDDKFLFVKDGSIRLWELRIRGSHLPIHMISDSWTTQKENVQKFDWNTFIISIYGLVHFHQNTKQFFVEFPVTKDAISLIQHQQFFLECINLILQKLFLVKSHPSNVSVLFSYEMDGLGSIFLPQNSLCMVMASNKFSNNTVMREKVLVIVLLNDESLEFAISTNSLTKHNLSIFSWFLTNF
jgi:hypothetical protein